MPNYNHVALMGNLTRDPELKYTPGGTPICEFTVAVNRKWKGKDQEQKEEVGFFDIVSWGRTAENVAKYMTKGKSIFVSGRLTQDRWNDKESGKKRSRVRITAEQVQFIGGRGEGGGGSQGGSQGGYGGQDPHAGSQGHQGGQGAPDDVPF